MDEQRVVRVSGPGELVATVPYVVGYRPREALVVMALRGPRRRLATTGCIALPERGRVDAVDDVVGAALGPVLRSGAERLLAVVYVRRRPSSTGALPERPVATAVGRMASESGVAVEDLIAVWEDRWWSYVCRDARCCPPQGHPLPDPATVPTVASMVVEGVAPAPSREALAASLDHAPGCLGDALAAALTRRRAEAASGHGPVTRARTLDALDRLLRLGAGREPPGDLDDVDAVADVLVGLGDVGARDAALCLVAEREPTTTGEVLRWLVRLAPREHVAPVATVLAFTAYLGGDGALANVALDRALAADRAYSMARMLLELLSGGAHPRLLRQLVSAIRGEVMPSTVGRVSPTA